jgi:pimeloyl-ACP methyl ester carboxylesterase
MFQTLAHIAFLALALHVPLARAHPGGVTTYQGTFADGAAYLIEAPSNWNGTLVLYSHGYVTPGSPNPAYDIGDPKTGQYLLAHGYALAGSSYASAGWAVAEALPDQIEVLDTFAELVGQPARTIAWGESMGGLITAGLIQQYPSRFAAALPMCGAVAGAVGTWNSLLDTAFAFNVLLAQGQLQVVDIGNPYTNYTNAEAILSSAQKTAPGRARIALSAALADIPGWYKPGSPQPGPTDYAEQETSQFLWLQQDAFLFGFDLRAELETRAGGNPSWNVGIDYGDQLAKSADRTEVTALYAQSGLSLDADLNTLSAALQIAADPAALTYLSDNIILDGQLSVPVLTLQTEGDGLVVNETDSAYETAVRGAGDGAELRRAFVDRAGHCTFTPGETIAAFEVLVRRLNSGRWSGLSPSTLNAVSQALGSQYNAFPPAYAAFVPGPYLRTYNGTPPRARVRFLKSRAARQP